MPEQRTIEVYADWKDLGGPTHMCWLHATPARAKEIFSFEYDPDWPRSRRALNLDPRRADSLDMGAWELVAHQLAQSAGVTVPEGTLRRFTVAHHTFLIKRFDRTSGGERLHFASALTLLNRLDGENASDGASYLELAELLMRNGAYASRDLEQLWRRVVFNICISNCDDHLRNHGFLLEQGGWTLSPAYDMNPDPYGDGLSLNISESDNALDLGLAHEVDDFFRVSNMRAAEIITEVTHVVRRWRTVAQEAHIPRDDQDRMEPAFRVVEEE